jgi:methyl-accepting chemotaxis protein/cytochrome b561
LHWFIGLCVVSQLAIVLVLGQLRSLQYGQYMLGLHRQVGFAILILSLIRVGMIARDEVPSLRSKLPRWQILAARLVHGGFYVALILQPILGMFIAWARGDAVTAFGIIPLPAPWDISDSARDRFMMAHVATAVTLTGLVLIHLGAVIFNHSKRHVWVLERMLPSAPPDELVNHVPVVAQLLAALGLVILIALATGINAVVKYRAFSAMNAAYLENDQAAADETRGAQAAWKEIVGIGSSGSAANAGRERTIAQIARTHLGDAATHAADPQSRADLTALSAEIAQLEAQKGAFATGVIGDIDAHLQDLIDTQTANAQQAHGDFAERSARGHDLIVVTVAPMALLGVVLALLLARSMSSSIRQMRRLVRGIESAEGSREIVVRGRGEFAALMRGMISMRRAIERKTQAAAEHRMALESERARAAVQQQADLRQAEEHRLAELRAVQRESEQRQANEHRLLRDQLAAEFESTISGIVNSVADTVEKMKSTAAQLALSAASTARCSKDASVIAASTKESVSRIANSSAQLSAAAQSVRKNAEQSKARASQGARDATAAKAEIDSLAAASREIGSITDIIFGVTRQTNLLAINARIEAARAGEAGKGFCIVADEVKNLANKTKTATDGIGGQVNQVTTAANRSIEIIQTMRSMIAELEESSSGIFAACDDQFNSTEDIAAKVTQISLSAGSVAENVAEAAQTASATEAMAADVVDTAEFLEEQANSLQDQVAAFVLQLQSMNSTVTPAAQAVAAGSGDGGYRTTRASGSLDGRISARGARG